MKPAPARVANLLGGLGPDERTGILVPVFQPGADIGVELAHRAVRAPLELSFGEFAEPALHQVQPARAGGGEVQDKAGVGEKPTSDGRGLMGGVVVENEMHVQVGGHFPVDLLQEPLELDGAMAGVQGAVRSRAWI